MQLLSLIDTLEFRINVDPQIKVDPGKDGKINKSRPSNKRRPWIFQKTLKYA